MPTQAKAVPLPAPGRFPKAIRRVCAAARGVPVGVWLLWLGVLCSVAVVGTLMSPPCDGQQYLKELSHYSRYLSGQVSTSLPYSPLCMIPTMWIARLLPLWLTIGLYGAAYFGGWMAQLGVGMQCATTQERRLLLYLAPLMTFFPGLLLSDSFTTGNVAYVLYAWLLVAAAYGWRRERWGCFYAVVLAASFAKVYLLTLLAIPLLCGKRQWLRSMATGSAALMIYALQARIWPQSFAVYLRTLEKMSHANHNFGCGLVGNLARLEVLRGVRFQTLSIVLYAVYAVVLFALLLRLSRLYRARSIRFESWLPVMLIGVVLLSPRIQQYDVAAVSLPMALVAWRGMRGEDGNIRWSVAIAALVVLLGLNIVLEINEDFIPVLADAWKYFEMVVMLGIFAEGVRGLLREASRTRARLAEDRQGSVLRVMPSPLPDASSLADVALGD